MESHLKSCYSVTHGCPCGYYTDPGHECRCTPGEVERYRGKISGPLLDRIDIQVEVPPVGYGHLAAGEPAESSADIRSRVEAARRLQRSRYGGTEGIFSNGQMQLVHIREFCAVAEDVARILASAMDELGLSARAYHRILKVARTVADLSGSETIQSIHVTEAIQYRSLDRRAAY